MIAAWMLYALLVGVLAGAGALVVDSLLRAHRLPTRWVWAGAMTLTLLWPLGHLIVRNWPRQTSVIPLPDPNRVAVLEPLMVQVTPESFLRSLDGPILLIWAVSSAVLLVLFSYLLFRTRHLRKEWTGEEADGRPVLYSRDQGPAVVGFVRPQIVLPSWCKELEDQTLRLILDHETEHVKAGDLRLMLTAGALTIVFPWHLPFWWQLQRLRLAVEGDCDLRVLRKYPERTRPYMELLLQVGSRIPNGQALAALLLEPEESLERRIRIMTMPFPKKPWIRGVVLTAFSGMLVALAFCTPRPTDIQEEVAEPEAIAIVIPPAPEEIPGLEVSDAPTFTPFTVAPEIQNRSEVTAALEREYPPLLRDAGIGGTVEVWFFVDETGRVTQVQTKESSGHKALDDAALRVAEIVAFHPALMREKPVPVWISFPITFTTKGPETGQPPKETSDPEKPDETPPDLILDRFEEARLEVASMEEAPPPEKDISAAPTFTPFTVSPDIKNRTSVARALERSYPPLLRDAGIGGTVHVWFFIDDEGVVQRTNIDKSSGHKALDDAALEVAGIIEFTPALNRDKRVPVWISLPITFATRQEER